MDEFEDIRSPEEEMDEFEYIRSPEEEDARIEALILRSLLTLHPVQVTLDEVLFEVCDEPDNFDQHDSFFRAVRDLAAAGLVHRNGQIVLPSRAALRFDELLGD